MTDLDKALAIPGRYGVTMRRPTAAHPDCDRPVQPDAAVQQEARRAAILAAAKTEHDTEGCICDPKYLHSCPRFTAAVLRQGKTS